MNRLNRLDSLLPKISAAFAFLAIPAAAVFGQGVAAPSGATAVAEDEEVIELSPFTISADEDADSYAAQASLAGNRIRTELKDVGSAIQVVTQKFLTDTNSKNSADLLVYTTNTEVAGQGGNFAGLGDGGILNDGSYVEPVPNTRVRGLASADNVRDFFLTDIPWDAYNVGRVDLQRGPNSILFGIGSPAGIINAGVNAANFQDSATLELQGGSFGSMRASADFNKVIIQDELAFRLALLADEKNYKQRPAYRNDHRVFGALRYDPRALAKNGMRTSFRLNYERGDIEGINPRLTPPMDAITPWFGPMNQATYPWQDSSQLTDRNHARYTPYAGAAGQRIWDGQVVTFEAGSPLQGIAFAADAKNFPADQPVENNNTTSGSYRGIQSYNQIGTNLRLPGWQISPYKSKSLTDSGVFDFYNNLIEGENRSNTNEFDAYNINLSQTFLDNKIGVELAYDHQDSTWDNRNFLAWDAAAISVDIMETFIDGSPNPNVGRPVVIGGGGSAGSGQTNRVREAYRATVFGELDFRNVLKSENFMSKLLGRHVLTGSLARQANDTVSTSWNNWFVGDGFAPTAGSSVGQASRDAVSLTYLGPSLIGSSSLGNLNLPRITARQQASSTSITQWDTVSASFINYSVPIVNPNSASFNDNTRPYTQARKYRDVVDSQTAVWQGFLWDGALVPMVGYRKDTAENFDAGSPNKVGGIVSNFADPEWRIPSGESEKGTGANGERLYSKIKGSSTSWSVVARLPRSMAADLPFGLDFSVFYNESDNFQPDAARKDILGQSIASPSGETKDYGFSVSALQNKISFKVNWYETSVTNATLSGVLANAYLIGAGEAWGQAAAVHVNNDLGVWPGDGNFGVTSDGQTLRWEPANSGRVDPTQGYDAVNNPYTQEAIDAQHAIQVASVNDWLAKPVPDTFLSAWGMTDYAAGGGSWSMNTVAVTGDTVSEGMEFELVAQPIRGLQIAVNASKTDAKRLSIGQAYTDWILKRWEDYQGPMGDMRLWGGGNGALDVGGGGSVRDKFNNETLPAYNLAVALNGSNVPEMRQWRFNAVANYDFQEGRFKGGNVGMSYRWMDKNVTGFPLNADGTGYNVNNPFYGDAEDAVDMWAGYTFKLSDRVNWRIQLNIRNAFATDSLIPVTVQPDGSPAAYRIPEPRTFSLTNTFKF